MKRIRSSRLLGTAAMTGLAAFMLAPSALAQAAPSAPEADQADGGLADIVVTARKVSEKLQDVPVTVTAFSGADLQRQNAITVSDIAKFTPGFTITQSPSNATVPLFTIRGQVQNDNLATLEPSVGTYLDGVYVARAYGLNAELVDIASVQVLKGPQGTLFGRNTSAGAVLIETNKPTLDVVGGEVRAGYGRFNDFNGSAVINLPVVQDVFGLRGAIQYHSRDGYITDVKTGAKYNNIDNISGRIKALWQIGSDFSIVASADFFHYKSNGPSREPTYVAGTALTYQGLASRSFGATAAVAPANVAAALNLAPQPPVTQIGALGTDPNRVSLSDAPLANTKTQTYSVTAQYDSSIGTIKAIGGYRKVTSFSNLDLDGSPYLLLQTSGYQDLHQWSGELQLTGRTSDGRLDYAAGVTYFTEAGFDRSTSNNAVGYSTFLGFAGLIPGVPAGTFIAPTTGAFRGDIDNKSFGVYGQATYHLTDKLSFTGGLRYSSDRKSIVTHNGTVAFNTNTYISCSLPTITTVANDNCAAGNKDTFKRVSYTAGLDYKVTPDVLIYAKASRGYRSGGENLRAAGNVATFAPFKPETNDEQEIGIKSQLFDRRLRINVAAYHNVITNAQRTLLLGLPGSTSLLTVLYNAQKQRTYGIEADIAAVLTPNVTLLLGGAITDPKYKTYTQPIAFGSTVFVDHSGDAFVYVPKRTFNAALDVHHQFSFGRFHGRADVSYQSQYYSAADLNVFTNPPGGPVITPNNPAAVSAFTVRPAAIVGANVGVTFGNGLDVTLWGRNLTNNRSFSQSLYVGSLGLVSSTRREPVTYGGTVSFKF